MKSNLNRINTAVVRKYLSEHVKGEISFSRLAEKLNSHVDQAIEIAREYMSFGQQVRYMKKLSGKSLEDISDFLFSQKNISLSRQAIHRYEKGDVIPSDELQETIIEYLKTNI